MLFHTYLFVFAFAPASLLVFHGLSTAGFNRVALSSAIVSSLIFYAYWRADYVPFLVASILINYALGSTIIWRHVTLRKPALAIGITANLAFLAYFKYVNFLVSQINAALGFSFTDLGIVLPLAVSFYTFQQIAYLVDCYRGKIHHNDFLQYCFLVTFFPHLVAGPIVRMQEIVHQFNLSTKPVLGNLCVGLTLFVVGLAKKVLLADYFATLADPAFAAATKGALSFNDAWIGALAYTLQLYFDFSGYSDMAIGLARMFGFRLAVNFLSPYQAVSIADFWRRWHITLSRFLRDYLYIPLGGNRRGQLRTYFNLLTTMALGGLWHGASWTFVAWGVYHGTLLGLARASTAALPLALRQHPLYRLAGPVLTFSAVVVGWVLFRSPDFHTAWRMLASMADLRSMSTPHGLMTYWAIAAGLLVCWLAPNAYQILYRFRPALLLREQIAIARRRVLSYGFEFRAAEAMALSLTFIASLYGMRGTVTKFLYFMF